MIRSAKRQDLAAIARLEAQYIEVAWNEKMLEESFLSGDYDFFVDEQSGEIVAYGFVQWILDEGDVCNVATSEKFRNRGSASGILKSMEEKAKERNATRLFLEVNENNFAAIALYKKAGFSEIYRRGGYYGKNAAVVMEKTI